MSLITIFENSDSVFLSVSVFLGILLFVTLIVVYIADNHNSSNYQYKINESTKSMRVYVVDMKNDNVLYFDHSDLRNKKVYSMAEFYEKFSPNDIERVSNWLNSLLVKDNDAEKYLEVNLSFNKNHRKNFSILQVEKVDYVKQRIFLNGFILQYLHSDKTNSSSKVYRFSSQDEFKKILSSSYSKGMTICFNFYEKKTLNTAIPHFVFSQIKNVFAPFINNKVEMLEYNEHQIVVCDFRSNTKLSVIQLVTTFKSEINRMLSISSNTSLYSFSVGVVNNKLFPNDGEKILETVLSLSDIARQDEQEILFFKPGKKLDVSESKNYRTEVERIIQDKRLKYLFRPIVNNENGRIIGYQMFVEPLDSFFGSVDELKTYAIRTEDDRDLFATIAKNGISRFIQEKNGDYKLFFPVSINEVSYINRTLTHIQRIKEIKLCFVIDENDLLNLNEEENEVLLEAIRSFKSKGFDIALTIHESDLTLSPTLYESVDIFILSIKSHLSKKGSGRQLPSFRGLIEKLLHYQKMLIATDIPSWDILELVVKFGVNNVASEVVAPMDENVLPISAKNITKLKNIAK